MVALAEVFVKARPNTTTFSRELEQEVVPASRRASKKIGDEFDKGGKEAGKRAGKSTGDAFNTGIIGSIKLMAAGAGFAGVVKSLFAGANLQAELGATTQIFQDQAQVIKDWSRSSADAFGVSRSEALATAKSFGSLFTAVGFSTEQASQMSRQWVEVAANMSAFADVPTAEVIEAVNAAAIGEYDSLQRLVPVISAAKIQQVALALSGKKAASELTEQDKVLALNKILLESNANSAGKAERAQGGFSISLEKAKAHLMDMVAEMGTNLIPIATELINLFTSGILPVLSSVSRAIGSTVLPAVKFLSSAVQQVLSLFQSLPGPVQTGILAFLAFRLTSGTLGDVLGKMLKPLQDVRAEVAQVAKAGDISTFGASIQVLQDKVPIIGAVASGFRSAKGDAEGFGATIKGIGGAAFGGLKSAASGIVGLFGGPWGVALGAGITLLSAFSAMSAKAEEEQRKLSDAGKSVADAIAEQNGVINENTRLKAAQAAEDAGLLEMANDLNISTDQITSAILGQGDALEGLRDQLDTVIEAHAIMESTEAGAVIVYDEVGTHAIKLRDKLNELVNAKDNNINKAKRVADAAGVEKKAEEDQAEATKKHKQAVDDLVGALEKYWGMLDSRVQSQEQWEEAWDQLSAAVQQNGLTLDVTTEAGRNNRDAMEALLTTDQQLMQQDIQAQVPMQQVIDKHNARIQALIVEANKLGFDKVQTEALVAAYNTVPKTVQTTLTQLGYDATRQQLIVLSAIQQLLAKGEDINDQTINARVRHNLGITSFGTIDFAGGRAEGGPISGPGTDTSDTAGLFWLSNNEWVHRAAAVKYYGNDFMAAINEMRIPREMFKGYAMGGRPDWTGGKWPVNMRAWLPTREQVIEAWYSKHIPTNVGGSGVQRWAPLVLQVLSMLGQSASLLPNVLRRMNQESGGNPRAINLWDSNAKRGTPSIGLMQTIGPTFNAYAGPFRSRGIYDPLANIYAGLNYAIHRYGNLRYAMDKPGGYALGGLVKFDDGGVWKSGTAGVNMSGNDEYVINPKKTGMGGKHYHLHLNVSNHPVDIVQQYNRMEQLELP